MARTTASILKALSACALIAAATIPSSIAVIAQESKAPDLPTLKTQFDQTIRTGDQPGALKLAMQMIAATEPEHIEELYAAAQLHARMGNREQAYLYLNRTIGAGFADRGRLREDEAFTEYRNDDLFKTLVRRTWARGYFDLLERPNREDVQMSPAIMKALAFKAGERVADIGAGTGYFTFPIAEAVGPSGVVWALDIAPEMIEVLEFRIKARKVDNVKVRRVSSDDPQLEPGGLDTILMVDSIHYVKDRTAYARKLLPGLAPGGRFVIIDYKPKPMSERPWGPPPEQQFPSEQLDGEMKAAGFRVLESYDFLPEQFFAIYVARVPGL
jgi:ubiquinone/menaquinone biosynthesis C-methylase UbiE